MSTPTPRDNIAKITPYVPGKSVAQIKSEIGVEEVIKLGSNENPLGAAVTLDDCLGVPLHHYPDTSHAAVFKTLAGFLDVETSQLIFGNGSDELLQMLGFAYVNAGQTILTSAQTFSEYAFVANIMGCQLVEVPYKEYRYDVDAIIAAVDAQTKLVFIANPNNPTGAIISQNEFDKLMANIPKSVIVVMDEAYYEYATADEFPNTVSALAMHPNLVILRTFSKIYGLAGLRVGYAIASTEIIETLNKVRQPFNVNSIALYAADLALKNQAHVVRSVQLNSAGRVQFEAAFSQMGIDYVSSQGNFIFARFAEKADEIYSSLIEAGIICRSMKGFGFADGLRITIGTEEQNRAVIENIRQKY
ncbi:MAG: histidinol-phosphate transaminase [bacterium]|nr:histidinol-phosphate transaminase [bacterium]